MILIMEQRSIDLNLSS